MSYQISQHEKQLERLRAKWKRQNEKLIGLPQKFGFASVAEFIVAIRTASRNTANKRTNPHLRRRSKITEAIVKQVSLLTAKHKPAREIARETGISLASVYNLQKKGKPKKT